MNNALTTLCFEYLIFILRTSSAHLAVNQSLLPVSCSSEQGQHTANTSASTCEARACILEQTMEAPLNFGRGTYDTTGVMKPAMPHGPCLPPVLTTPPVSNPGSPKDDRP